MNNASYINNPSILVGGVPTPLKNMSSSIGMMTCSIFLENKAVMFLSPPVSQYSHHIPIETTIKSPLNPIKSPLHS